MPVRSRTYNTVKDSFVLTVPELAFRDIKSVKREGLGFDIVRTGTPVNRQVLYTASGGLFTFENAFAGVVIDHGSYDELVTEKVFVIWDE